MLGNLPNDTLKASLSRGNGEPSAPNSLQFLECLQDVLPFAGCLHLEELKAITNGFLVNLVHVFGCSDPDVSDEFSHMLND